MTMRDHIAEAVNHRLNRNTPDGSRTVLRSTKYQLSSLSSLYCLSFWVWRRNGSNMLEIQHQIYQNGQHQQVSSKFT